MSPFHTPSLRLASVILLLAFAASLADAQVSSLFGASPSPVGYPSTDLFGDDYGLSSVYEVAYSTDDPASPLSNGIDPFASPRSLTSLFDGSSALRTSPSSPESPAPPRSYRAHLVYTDHTPSGWEYRTTSKTVRWTPSFDNLRIDTSSSSSGMDGTALDYAILIGIIVALLLVTCCIIGTAWCCSIIKERNVGIAQVYRKVWAMRPGRSSQWGSIPVNTEDL